MLHGRGPGEALLSGSQSPDCRGQAAWVASRTELSHHQSNNQQAKALSLKSKTSTTLPPHTKSTPHGGDVGGGRGIPGYIQSPLSLHGEGLGFSPKLQRRPCTMDVEPSKLDESGCKTFFLAWTSHSRFQT